MADYSFIGYAPGSINIGGTISVSGTYDPDTGRRVFDVNDAAGGNVLGGANGRADEGTFFDGDRYNNEAGDDTTQTGSVTNLDGSTTFLSGNIYLENAYVLTKPGGGTITLYAVEVDGALAGYIVSEPLEAGVNYTASQFNVTPTGAGAGNVPPPDTADPTALIDVPCFTAGTLILTPQGERRIEDLCANDLVVTMDHGDQPIRWIGSSPRRAVGPLAPIRICAGALGNTRDLFVSPQHRVLLRGGQAELLFGESEVLVPAKTLVNDRSITRVIGGEVVYYHMLFDRHQIVWSEGAPTESFHPGSVGWNAMDAATRNEILSIFPQLDGGNFENYGASARMSLKSHEAMTLRNMIWQ
ncbi:Hint domain-containing protein [Loktanella agnita]|uniref:Hint domain-containing protein n=1 Tax=Loktanella agnita TaxID=287097 RepID=UPI003986F815